MNKKINFTKEDLSKSLSKKTGFSISLSKKLIKDLLNILILNIQNGGLSLKNIGTFNLIKKNKRLGRNPKTKEEFTINSRISLSFIASKKLLNTINKNR